jgi:hypothetical protein
MGRPTIQETAEAERTRGSEVVAVVDAGGGSGILLLQRRAGPGARAGFIAVRAVDLVRNQVGVGLTITEAKVLRDALTAWIGDGA